ncbi:cytochrome P450 [Streptomyces flavovirens]|uniref:cytochrome P450 n=1 Tax=Streptomyces flavovirens TaxID=52258 RepID=UPI0031EECB6A
MLTEDHEIGGVPLAAGSRVALLYASANRDERHYPDPARFDITRRPSDHLAFGRGEHVCVGMHLARLEMSALLERLADRVAGFRVLDRRPLINNGFARPRPPGSGDRTRGLTLGTASREAPPGPPRYDRRRPGASSRSPCRRCGPPYGAWRSEGAPGGDPARAFDGHAPACRS